MFFLTQGASELTCSRARNPNPKVDPKLMSFPILANAAGAHSPGKRSWAGGGGNHSRSDGRTSEKRGGDRGRILQWQGIKLVRDLSPGLYSVTYEL